jgi:hypothetical protein
MNGYGVLGGAKIDVRVTRLQGCIIYKYIVYRAIGEQRYTVCKDYWIAWMDIGLLRGRERCKGSDEQR